MEGTCPQCRIRLDLPASGAYQCERCRTRFEVALGSPRPPAPPHPAPPLPGMAPWQPVAAPTAAPALGVDPALQAPCATHPGNAAEGICERCGDFMCRLCATPVEGRLYCPRCFDLLYNRGALHFTHRQFTLPGTAFGLGLAAFFTSLVGFLFCSLFFSIPLGVFGVLAGMRGLKEHHLRPELPNRGYTTWGLALSAASLLISLGMAGFLVWTFVRAASS